MSQEGSPSQLHRDIKLLGMGPFWTHPIYLFIRSFICILYNKHVNVSKVYS